MPGLWIVGLFVLLFIVIAVTAYTQNAKRREAFEALARELGFTFDSSSQSPLREWHEPFGIFTRGSSRRAYNTLSGRIELFGGDSQVRCGDYRYTTGSGDKQQTHRFSYFLVSVPFLALPRMKLRPEHFLDKIAGAIGFEDIDFESLEFSRKYMVSSQDKRFTYDLIDPRMIEFLMSNPPPAHLEFAPGRLLLSSGSGTWQPKKHAACIRWCQAFVSHWPDHVQRSLAEAN